LPLEKPKIASHTEEHIGVSAAFLRSFAAEVPGGDPFAVTTSQICDAIIRPATQKRCCAYVELLVGKVDVDGRPWLGPPTVFVTHTWQFPFGVPLSVMLNYGDENPEAYFFFTMFAYNQHRRLLGRMQDKSLADMIQRNVERIGRMLVVLHPWSDPLTLRRTWCLYEVMIALTTGDIRKEDSVTIDIRVPPSEEASFHKALLSDFDAASNGFLHVKVQNSQSSHPDPQRMLLQLMEEAVGVDRLNTKLHALMHTWLLATKIRLQHIAEVQT